MSTPNITKVDESGDPVEGDVQINGIVPRAGDGSGEVSFDRVDVTEELKALGEDSDVMLSKVFKILGQLDDSEGAGVVGHNTAETGDAIGVEGKTESDDGYGLYTEDDAHVGGEMESKSVSTEVTHIGNYRLEYDETTDQLDVVFEG